MRSTFLGWPSETSPAPSCFVLANAVEPCRPALLPSPHEPVLAVSPPPHTTPIFQKSQMCLLWVESSLFKLTPRNANNNQSWGEAVLEGEAALEGLVCINSFNPHKNFMKS